MNHGIMRKMMTQKIQIRLRIRGRVQGVFFRAKTKQEADRIGIKGWVRNLPDRSVEAILQGDPEKVTRMTDWCKKGPPLSRVDHVDTEADTILSDFETFDILY
ncbi:MAG: acylphosphatase [Desulfobacula sp.]